jgi:hypothetical protein
MGKPKSSKRGAAGLIARLEAGVGEDDLGADDDLGAAAGIGFPKRSSSGAAGVAEDAGGAAFAAGTLSALAGRL